MLRSWNRMKKKPDGCRTIFIGNLNFEITEQIIFEAFKACGKIERIRFGSRSNPGPQAGFGHITFHDENAALKAVKLNGNLVMGRSIHIDYVDSPKESKLKKRKTLKPTEASQANNSSKKKPKVSIAKQVS